MAILFIANDDEAGSLVNWLRSHADETAVPPNMKAASIWLSEREEFEATYYDVPVKFAAAIGRAVDDLSKTEASHDEAFNSSVSVDNLNRSQLDYAEKPCPSEFDNSALFNCRTNHAAPDWRQFDALEIHGMMDNNGESSPAESGEDPDFWCIMGHLKGGGTDCITDCTTRWMADVSAELCRISDLKITNDV